MAPFYVFPLLRSGNRHGRARFYGMNIVRYFLSPSRCLSRKPTHVVVRQTLGGPW